MITFETTYSRSSTSPVFIFWTPSTSWIEYVVNTYETPGLKTIPETELYLNHSTTPVMLRDTNASTDITACTKIIKRVSYKDQATHDNFFADPQVQSQLALEQQYYQSMGFAIGTEQIS